MTNPNEDQDWLDALAGKPNPNADPEVTRRATLLRQAIQRHEAALGINEFDSEAEWQKLKIRMRREGLLEEEQHATLKTLFLQLIAALTARLNKRIVKFAMAMSVIFATLMMLLQPMLLVQTTSTRGSDTRTQVIYEQNPADAANSIVADLAAVGRAARIEKNGDHIVVHVDDAVANQSVESHNKELDLFERYSITVGGVKAFQVEIRPDSKPAKDGR